MSDVTHNKMRIRAIKTPQDSPPEGANTQLWQTDKFVANSSLLSMNVTVAFLINVPVGHCLVLKGNLRLIIPFQRTPTINRSHASCTNRSLWNAKDNFGNWQMLVYFGRRCRIMQLFTINNKNQISFWTYMSSVLLQPLESPSNQIEIASVLANGQQVLGVSWLWIWWRVARPLTRTCSASMTDASGRRWTLMKPLIKALTNTHVLIYWMNMRAWKDSNSGAAQALIRNIWNGLKTAYWPFSAMFTSPSWCLVSWRFWNVMENSSMCASTGRWE